MFYSEVWVTFLLVGSLGYNPRHLIRGKDQGDV